MMSTGERVVEHDVSHNYQLTKAPGTFSLCDNSAFHNCAALFSHFKNQPHNLTHKRLSIFWGKLWMMNTKLCKATHEKLWGKKHWHAVISLCCQNLV